MNSKKLLSKITEKWPAKALSLAAAVILSVFFKLNSLETHVFSARLHVDASETLVSPDSFAKVVRVSLRGEADSIYSIAEEDIEPYIDLTRYVNEGAYYVPVQIRMKANGAVTPLEITVDPPEIRLNLERKLSRTVPVTPVFRGNPAEGFKITDQTLFPASVTAEGPRSIMETITGFNTEAIDLEGRSENFTVTVNIVNGNSDIVIRGNRLIEYRGIIE